MSKASSGIKKALVYNSSEYLDLKKQHDQLCKKLTDDGIIQAEGKVEVLKDQIKISSQKYKQALTQIKQLKTSLDNVLQVKKGVIHPFKILYQNHKGKQTTEATAVSILSDIHAEEKVESKSVNFLNEYNPVICKARMENYFKGLLRLIEIERNGVSINELVINLLGDEIHGYIHSEFKKSNYLSPVQAIMFVQEILISGFDYLKKYGNFKKITIICMEGNHARTEEKMEVSTSYMNSFEWLLYKQLELHYKNDGIIQFVIPESILYYYNIYDKVIRTLHGGEIRYQGGVGGIDVPVKKAISQWDKSKKADLTLFGHWHTFSASEQYVSNGSVVGFNSYALSIKADFRPPQQVFFLVDNVRGRTLTAPIYLDKGIK